MSETDTTPADDVPQDPAMDGVEGTQDPEATDDQDA